MHSSIIWRRTIPNIPTCPTSRQSASKHRVIHFDMEPGDALAFDGMIVHSAMGNRTSTRRRRGYAIRFACEGATYPAPRYRHGVAARSRQWRMDPPFVARSSRWSTRRHSDLTGRGAAGLQAPAAPPVGVTDVNIGECSKPVASNVRQGNLFASKATVSSTSTVTMKRPMHEKTPPPKFR